jgi:DNA-binding beta-propeller fold protein YncE
MDDEGDFMKNSTMGIVLTTALALTLPMPAQNSVRVYVPRGVQPYGIAFDGANVWVANNGSNTMSKF